MSQEKTLQNGQKERKKEALQTKGLPKVTKGVGGCSQHTGPQGKNVHNNGRKRNNEIRPQLVFSYNAIIIPSFYPFYDLDPYVEERHNKIIYVVRSKSSKGSK